MASSSLMVSMSRWNQGNSAMSEARFLIFGDLHGRILPAFRLAAAREREHGLRLDGLLQVGDLGYFPDPSRLDKATARHAADDPLELGTCLVVQPNREADEVFHGRDGPPPTLWFTAGNHEDFDALAGLESGGGRRSSSFPVDAYGLVRCVRDVAPAPAAQQAPIHLSRLLCSPRRKPALRHRHRARRRSDVAVYA